VLAESLSCYMNHTTMEILFAMLPNEQKSPQEVNGHDPWIKIISTQSLKCSTCSTSDTKQCLKADCITIATSIDNHFLGKTKPTNSICRNIWELHDDGDCGKVWFDFMLSSCVSKLFPKHWHCPPWWLPEIFLHNDQDQVSALSNVSAWWIIC